MSNGANPYILFLILILLVFGSDPDAAKKIEVVKNIVDRVSTTFANLRAGIQTMNTDFEEIQVMLLDLNNKPGGGPA